MDIYGWLTRLQQPPHILLSASLSFGNDFEGARRGFSFVLSENGLRHVQGMHVITQFRDLIRCYEKLMYFVPFPCCLSSRTRLARLLPTLL